uniref:RNA-directed DNA polymerase n=1 Tax=Cacopsylla melanoneura TaxID=428564 RepID=A0A8D9BQ04_9HEMI
MTFTYKREKVEYTYRIDNIPTQEISSTKDLGVIVSNNLSWKEHIEKTTKKAYSILGCIIRHCDTIHDMDAILLLYKSLVRSILEYGSIVWCPQTQVDRNRIENIQKKFVRYLFYKLNGFYPKYPNYIPYNSLIENVPIDSVQSRFSQNQIQFLKNIFSNQIDSPYILSNINIQVPKPRLRPNLSTFFTLPGSRNDHYLKSPIYYAMQQYNQLVPKPVLF